MMKNCFVCVLTFLFLFNYVHGNEDKDIKNLQDSILKSLDTQNKLVYKHIVSSVTPDGSVVTFEDGMSFAIDWWYRSIPKTWKAGDQIYIEYDFSYLECSLKHAASLEIAWGVLKTRPFPAQTVKSVRNAINDPVLFSQITLDNGYIFKSIEAQQLGEYRVKDRIIILANSDYAYQIWNLEKKIIVEAECVGNLQQEEKKPIEIQDILGMEARLNTQVLQQPEAAKAVVTSLVSYTAGLNNKGRPIGVFLFVGPTGVGKTELAKTLASEIYHKPSHLIRFDMSHFTEYHSISRLIGSPPGYVNHEEGGQLTAPLIENPQVIVLLDEIEKAHAQVRKVFLPIFDEGFILDTKNTHVSCNDTVFIMTSNICAKQIAELFNEGYSSEEILSLIEADLMEALSPELYNRVEVVLFRPLAQETMSALVKLMLDKLQKHVFLEKEIRLEFDDSIKSFLEKEGYHPLLGARPLKRLIEKKVVATLAYYIIKEGIKKGDELTIFYDQDKDEVEIKHAARLDS